MNCKDKGVDISTKLVFLTPDTCTVILLDGRRPSDIFHFHEENEGFSSFKSFCISLIGPVLFFR